MQRHGADLRNVEMRAIDSQYKDIYRFINQHGLDKDDRTGVGTLSALAGWMRHDLRDNHLPVTSLRVIRPEKFIHEMLWFVSGSSSIKYLKDNNVGIWDSWFIPGTDRYEEPVPYTVDELANMYVEARGVLPFTELFQSIPTKPSFEELQSALILSGIPKNWWQAVIEEEFSTNEYPVDPQDLDVNIKGGALKITMTRFQGVLLCCSIMKDLGCGYINPKAGGPNRPLFDVLADVMVAVKNTAGLVWDNNQIASASGIDLFKDLVFCMGFERGADIEEEQHARNILAKLTPEEEASYRESAARLGISTTVIPTAQEVGFRERVKLANKRGLGAELFEYYDKDMPKQKFSDTYAELNVDLCPELASGADLFASEVELLGAWLTEKGIPFEVTHPAVKPVSLQTRLNRVSKNDKEKWDKINAVIDEPWEDLAENATGKSILEAGELVKVEIFKDGKFQKIEIRNIVAACLHITLTDLGVNQYKLIDADIGKGAYGPQWRHYQDVQLINFDEWPAFEKHGYTHVSDVSAGAPSNEYMINPFIGKLVVHREIDQLQNAIDMLKKDPDSRRIYVTSCNPGTNWQAALEPCHLYFQFISHEKDLRDFEEDFAKLDLTGEYIDAFKDSDLSHGDEDRDDNEFLKLAKEFAASKGVPTRWLSIAVVLRSWDAGGGAVFNTPQYAVLTRMVAEVVGMEAREMFIMGVDSHIYENQKELVDEVIYTDYQNDNPQLHITRKVTSIDDFKIDDFVVTGYDPVPNTKVMPIAR
jgi:thymidylate synthase